MDNGIDLARDIILWISMMYVLYGRGGEPSAMDRSDADGLPAASSVTVAEAKGKNAPDTVSFPRPRVRGWLVKLSKGTNGGVRAKEVYLTKKMQSGGVLKCDCRS
jgi:hypothetical protein